MTCPDVRRWGRWLVVAMVTCAVVSPDRTWGADETPSPSPEAAATQPETFTLASSAFHNGAPIPSPFSCDGLDVSPPVEWTAAPEGTKSFVLIMEDPDAPTKTWVHWIVFNIPPEWRQIPQAFPEHVVMADGLQQGRNDFGFHRYGGPCPPSNARHRYVFVLYALDTMLSLPSQDTQPALAADIRHAMDGHVLGQTQLVGLYQRQQTTP